MQGPEDGMRPVWGVLLFCLPNKLEVFVDIILSFDLSLAAKRTGLLLFGRNCQTTESSN